MNYRSPKPVKVASMDKSLLKKSVTQREQVILREHIALDKTLIKDEDAFSIKSASASKFHDVSPPSLTPLEDVIRSRSKPIMAGASPIIPLSAVIPEKSLMAGKPLNAPLTVIIPGKPFIAAGSLKAPVPDVIPNKTLIPSESMIASGSLNAPMPGVIPNGAVIPSEPLIGIESLIASESVIAHESLLDIPSPLIEGPPVPQTNGAGKQRY